ncbi:uncharacterized protein K02A2.6-like [Octopus bimaculoides]|uniref:uncharacterized protein K02A2.6-like n=1 Tax=Octopus bimaculoides TaxID=37653 RepID=UPI00071C50AE|nr:uncharacterized protein K02A2.6-like [Octopus bimaculoides]|eukprot:XP_014788759.1 PREDICTED: uncharacterized protein K02A2.6-like [Octopus bimaculoides]
MDCNVEEIVKACRGCALAAKAPTTKWQLWPKTNIPWSRLHVNYAGSLKSSYYLVVVDSFSKWPAVHKCKKPTSVVTVRFLHKLFTRYGIPDTIVSDNRTQFSSDEFRKFCKMFIIIHVTTPPYHSKSNRQVERFVDTMKRVLKKANNEVMDDLALQQFLRVY